MLAQIPRSRVLAPRTLAGAAGLIAVAGCRNATDPSYSLVGGAPTVATALAAVPTGTYTLQGVVGDWSPGRVWGDSVGGSPRPTPLAGATVAVALVTRTSTTGDTANAGTVLTPFARVTTGADGSFGVSGVASGRYALDVSPPAGSSLAAVRAYAVSFAPGSPCPVYITFGMAPTGGVTGETGCITSSPPGSGPSGRGPPGRQDSLRSWYACPVAPAGTAGPGAVRGRVLANSASGVTGTVGGATVRLTLLALLKTDSASTPGPAPDLRASTTADVGGAFTIGGLPFGTYRIDVTPPVGRRLRAQTLQSGAPRPNDPACLVVLLNPS